MNFEKGLEIYELWERWDDLSNLMSSTGEGIKKKIKEPEGAKKHSSPWSLFGPSAPHHATSTCEDVGLASNTMSEEHCTWPDTLGASQVPASSSGAHLCMSERGCDEHWSYPSPSSALQGTAELSSPPGFPWVKNCFCMPSKIGLHAITGCMYQGLLTSLAWVRSNSLAVKKEQLLTTINSLHVQWHPHLIHKVLQTEQVCYRMAKWCLYSRWCMEASKVT